MNGPKDPKPRVLSLPEAQGGLLETPPRWQYKQQEVQPLPVGGAFARPVQNKIFLYFPSSGQYFLVAMVIYWLP